MKKPDPKRRTPQKKPVRWIVFTLFSVLFCLVLLGGAILFAFYVQIDRSLPSVDAL